MIFSWYRNRKIRKQYKNLLFSIRNVLTTDDDILSAEEKKSLTELKTQLEDIGKKAAPEKEQEIDHIGEKFACVLPRKSFFFTMRGLLDVVAVAASVAFGIRALYLQPFKIPTSSMQPTLFGIHYIDDAEAKPYQNGLTRLMLPWGASRAKLTVKSGGTFYPGYQPYNMGLPELLSHLFRPEDFFASGSTFRIGDDLYTMPGSLGSNLVPYLDSLKINEEFEPGEVICDGWMSSGDHLFVDRVSPHFLDFRRGDVIVFNTENITCSTQPMGGYYYVKRLVGLPGDTLKIVNDTLMIKPRGETEFRSSSEFSPRFQMINSKRGGYQGHKAGGLLAEGQEIVVPDRYFFAMGDNTSHSLDGRNWGFIPRHNMIGRALNVFWPISRRWGFADTRPALDVPTGKPENPYLQIPQMRLQ